MQDFFRLNNGLRSQKAKKPNSGELKTVQIRHAKIVTPVESVNSTANKIELKTILLYTRYGYL